MATPALARQRDAKYAVQVQAASIFKFLSSTFFQMPRPVQVIGWIALLLLFIYLVLSPAVGITYYQGKIEQLAFDHTTGKPTYSAISGLTVTKGSSVVTNKDGEFTFAGRWPYIPFRAVEFTIDDQSLGAEEVAIPTPSPIISMFNPNPQKIFYVPSSTVTGSNDVLQRFFLDSRKAMEALNKSKQANLQQPAPAQPTAWHPSRPSLIPVVYAATAPSSERAYTLRLREAKVRGVTGEVQAYLDVRIDGQSFRSSNLPDANSPESRDLTILGETSLHFDSVYFSVPEHARHVAISMIQRRSFLQRDPTIGTVSLTLDPNDTNTSPVLHGGSLELAVEILPPTALRCVTVNSQRKSFIAGTWLDMDDRRLGDVVRIRYDRGANFGESRYVSSTDISSGLDSFDHFADLISLFASQPIRATVDFASGSSVNLAAFCSTRTSSTGSSMEPYYRGLAYYGARDYSTALTEMDKALQANPSVAQPHYMKGAILAKLQRFGEADEEFKQALSLAPDAQAILATYAWMIVEQMPSASQAQLLEAKRMADRAVHFLPYAGNYETLGWAEFRLHQYDSALADLRRSESSCVASCKDSTDWQEIEFHLGQAYAFLKKKPEARQAFLAVLKYAEQQPDISEDKYVRQAKAALGAT